MEVVGVTFSIDLKGNVPIYDQEQVTWCGATSAQMILDGCPKSDDRIYYSQGEIWNNIQSKKSAYIGKKSSSCLADWFTDPYSLKDCIIQLEKTSNFTWDVFSNKEYELAMSRIIYFMNKYKYPVPVLIYDGYHWAVIVGLKTDNAPDAGSTVSLESITIYNPDTYKTFVESVPADYWFQSIFYIVKTNTQLKCSWEDHYVSICDQSDKLPFIARISSEIVPTDWRRDIGEDTATRIATDYVLMLSNRVDGVPNVKITRPVKNLKPMKVRELVTPRQKNTSRDLYYYLIPFGNEQEKDYGNRLARLSVIVDAHAEDKRHDHLHFGFSRGYFRYLLREEAIDIASRAMGLNKQDSADIEAELVFQPSKISYSRINPFWKINFKESELYIDNMGRVHSMIEVDRPGN